MKIIINDIIKNIKGNNIIKFTSKYGEAYAFWDGTDPQINKEYFVELEIPTILSWQKDIVATQEKYLIRTENNKIYLIGLLESVDEDGYTVIRLGESIVSVETQGKPLDLGGFVELSTDSLILYEVNY